MRAPGAGADCAFLAGIDFAPVEACTKSVEGQNLHQVNGQETLTLSPTLTFVPWVIYNKVWEDSNQWDSLKSIMTVACKYAPAGSNGCSKQIANEITLKNALRRYSWIKWIMKVGRIGREKPGFATWFAAVLNSLD